MADNVDITSGSGTTIATDDVGGIQYQVVKLDVGGDGVAIPLSVDAPLPVQDLTVLNTITGNLSLDGSTHWQLSVYGGGVIPSRSVRVKSILLNDPAALVYVGSSGEFYELEPGESVELHCADLMYIWAHTVPGEIATVVWAATVVGYPDPYDPMSYLDWQV